MIYAAAMRVLLWMPRHIDLAGGHRVQMRQTAAALRREGIDAVEADDADPDLAGIDLVHAFGSASAADIHRLRARGLPVALSTIYADRAYRLGGAGRVTPRSVAGRLRRAVRVGRGGAGAALAEWPGEIEFTARFSAVDVLLPNAAGEEAAIRRELHVATPAVVVPNGVDPELFSDGEGDRSGVLYVGRIDPYKNQLGLIRALRNEGVPLTICGPTHPHHHEYYQECLAAGRGWVQFVGPVPHQQLAQLYQRAAVHVVPSGFETTGLVSLEAALCGCQVVSTYRGYAREYLGGDARYCDPRSSMSIRQAVIDSLNDPLPMEPLRQRILAQFTWRHAALATISAYDRVMHRHRR